MKMSVLINVKLILPSGNNPVQWIFMSAFHTSRWSTFRNLFVDGCAFPLVVALRMDLLRLSLISLSQSALVSLKATGSRLQYKTNLPKLMELDKPGRGCESCNFLSIEFSCFSCVTIITTTM